QIVHQKNTILLRAVLLHQITLSNLQRADNQLLLPPGQHIHRIHTAVTQPQFSPLGPGLGIAKLGVALELLIQHLRQWLLPIPAAVIAEGEVLQRHQLGEDILEHGLELLQVSLPESIQLLSRCHQLYLPGLPHGTLYSTTSEQAVTLLEAFLQALPCREKLMFPVEHTPIQVLSTLFPRSFQQPEAVRVAQLQGQGRSQFRKAAHLLPIHTDLVIGFLAARDPNGIGYPTALRDFTEDGAGLFAVTYDRLQAGAAEGTGQTKQVNGFQQAGLAAAIGAMDEIDAGRGV